MPWQDILAGHCGAFIWRIILAHLFGRFSQSMKQANYKASKKTKRTEKECTISGSVSYFAFDAGSLEPANCGLATVVIVDLWIFTANEIYIMKKKLGPISVVLDCFLVPCVRQFPSKRGGEPIIATRC
jgi:hypothetical protein